MDHQASSSKTKRCFRFLPAEVKEMQERLNPLANRKPDWVLMSELAVKFSESRNRTGMVPVNPKQLLNWFHYHRYKPNRKVARGAPPEPRITRGFRADQQPSRELTVFGQDAGSSSTGNNPVFGDPMSYEVKSADGAWYDVHDFLSLRWNESGEMEVMVQFSGFGTEQSEWINARTCLRQRSLPCKDMECAAVNLRDIVLCYKLTQGSGLYFDAKVKDILRKPHDSIACDCRFFVRYQHDQSEELVSLRKLCLRPEKLQTWHELQRKRNTGVTQQIMVASS